MNLNSIFSEIRKECGWESYPSELIVPAIAHLEIGHVKTMLDSLQYFTKEVMREDAGDIGDERQRLSLAIFRILIGSELAVEEDMLRHLPDVLPFTQKLILDVIARRKYLAAYAAIVALKESTKRKSVKKRCEETLKALGF